jgi:uncharacterized protein (TIGR02611 family)
MSDTLTREFEAGSSHSHPLRRFLRRCRAWIELHPKARWLYRILVGLLGVAIVLVGVVLIPLPGPGWLIVFLGIAVLGTEFPAAHRVNVFLKRQLHRFWEAWRGWRASRAERRTARSDR